MKCPECGKNVTLENPYRPFCCDRCKLVDLDKWFSGDYLVPGYEQAEPDEETE